MTLEDVLAEMEDGDMIEIERMATGRPGFLITATCNRRDFKMGVAMDHGGGLGIAQRLMLALLASRHTRENGGRA